MAPESADQWMLVGTIVGPFGVRGELKVELNTDFPDRFKGLDTVFVGTDRSRRTVLGSRRHQGRVLLRLEGIDSADDAGALRGKELCVPRSQAMPLPEGHYFLDDLIGMSVVTAGGRELGHVSDVLRTGSNDVFVVGAGRGTILVPAIRDAVRTMDLEARRIVVEEWILRADE